MPNSIIRNVDAISGELRMRAFVDQGAPPFPEDTVSVTDNVALSIAHTISISDNVNVVEIADVRNNNLYRVDSVTATDAIAFAGSFGITLTDSVTTSENATSVAAMYRSLNDTCTATDAPAATVAKALADSVTVTESAVTDLTLAGVTWNPSDIGTGVGLSNSNHTASKTTPSSWTAARATSGKSTGKHYFEVSTSNPSYNQCAGVCSGSMSLSAVAGNTVDSIVFLGVYIITNSTGTFMGAAAGGTWGGAGTYYTVQIAFDAGAKLFWARRVGAYDWNGNASANPATGVGGISFGGSGPFYPVCGLYNNAEGDNVTLICDPLLITGSIPSGFSLLT